MNIISINVCPVLVYRYFGCFSLEERLLPLSQESFVYCRFLDNMVKSLLSPLPPNSNRIWLACCSESVGSRTVKLLCVSECEAHSGIFKDMTKQTHHHHPCCQLDFCLDSWIFCHNLFN